jgi:hypothetical protein
MDHLKEGESAKGVTGNIPTGETAGGPDISRF